MNTFVFTKKGKELFDQLPVEVQERIKKKLSELKTHPDLFTLLKKLQGIEPRVHRLRIGSYRLIIDLFSKKEEELTFRILAVGNRKEIYN